MAASTSSDLNTQFLASRSWVTVAIPGELERTEELTCCLNDCDFVSKTLMGRNLYY